MDYKDFTKRQEAFNKFVKYRKDVLNSVENGDFADVFTELCTKALSGNCIAQDCVAYFFNKGVPDLLAPNFEYYMSWQILAGANGNEFALEKMEFFLNSALEELIDDEEVLTEAMRRGNITKDNAIMVISNLLCEGMVDELKINPKNLVNISNTASLYTPEKNRVFLEALDDCLPDVADFLMS
ncbi:MAG: hypothetical protein J6K39_03945 [Clostridia bacterium]|nr:hypothetical protein [Clostridia bacterium]